MISDCLANASPEGQSADSTITRLDAARASGAPSAIRPASSRAAGSAWPAGTSLFTRPTSASLAAGKCSPVSAISIAT